MWVRAEPCLGVPGSRAYAVEQVLAEGKPWTREGGGIDQSQPRPARQRPLFAVFLTVGGIADDAVFRVLGGDVARPREKKGAGAHLAFMYQKRRKRRRAAVGGSAWAGNQGRRDQGRRGAAYAAGRWVRTGIWAPEPAALAAHFLYGPSAKW